MASIFGIIDLVRRRMAFDFSDSLIERRLRMAITIVAALVAAWVVISGYRWARPQNNGPQAGLTDQIFFAAVPALACALGWLGNNLRIWSWALAFASIYGAFWIGARVAAHDGSYMTRLVYCENMLKLHVALALFGLAALIIVTLRNWLGARKSPPAKIRAGVLLALVWLFIGAGLAL
jgi:hypothetical protein